MDKILKIKEKYENLNKEYEKNSRKYSNLRLLFALIAIGIILANFKRIFTIPYFTLALLAIVAFFIAVHKEHISDDYSRQAKKLIDIANSYTQRKEGKWTEFSDTGAEFFRENDPAFLEDLQILGDNSLFQFLNCGKSYGGRKKLSEKLKISFKENEKTIGKKAQITQDAIEILKEKPELVLLFQETISGIDGIERLYSENEKNTFNMKRKFSNLDFIISLAISLLAIVLAILSKNHVECLLMLIPVVFIQFLSALLYQNAFDKEISETGKKLRQVREMQKVCKLLEKENFQGGELGIVQSKLNACQEVFTKLKKIDALESFRVNFVMWFIGNIFLSLNRFIIREYSKIQENDKLKLYDAICAMEDLEVLVSLTTINFVKETVVRPQFTNEIKIYCKNIKHPLINDEVCKGNDFQSGRDINVITGSNMSGKTSFMKTIGTNLVLAYSGAFVNGDEFVAPIMKLYTSINVKDDINKGISKFYAELLRLKDAMETTEKGQPMILFVDEIFSGTNYQDRMYGAKNILENLSKKNIIGFITTHDFELCQINIENLANYHFSEEYVNGKMQFSHKIQKGKCQGTNAVALMEQVGILS